jgi:hypothetical protein
MSDLWQEILGERYLQDLSYGGPGHDDTVSIPEWTSILAQFAGQAYACDRVGRADLCRVRLVQVAAVAVAAIESWDRLHAPPESSFEQLRALPDTPAGVVSPGPVATPARECLT